MKRIAKKFSELQRIRKKAFIAFVMGGYPSRGESLALARELEKKGADIIEIGVPFSDPIADGPVIQAAGHQALKHGTSLADCLEMVGELRRHLRLPLLLMTYYNPLFNLGLGNFARRARQAGLDGVIIPDMTAEEAGEVQKALKKEKIDLVLFVAPTSTPERLRKADKRASGFIYVISLLGVTGSRDVKGKEIKKFLQRIKGRLKLPLAVGFGVSTPAEARQIAALPGVSGVIVGSAIIKEMAKGKNREARLKKAGALAGRLARAIKQ